MDGSDQKRKKIRALNPPSLLPFTPGAASVSQFSKSSPGEKSVCSSRARRLVLHMRKRDYENCFRAKAALGTREKEFRAKVQPRTEEIK